MCFESNFEIFWIPFVNNPFFHATVEEFSDFGKAKSLQENVILNYSDFYWTSLRCCNIESERKSLLKIQKAGKVCFLMEHEDFQGKINNAIGKGQEKLLTKRLIIHCKTSIVAAAIFPFTNFQSQFCTIALNNHNLS